MARPLRLLVAVLIALGTIGISAAQPTHAAGTQVADCSFATLQKDLQAGGDWYYTAGQCPSPIIDTSTISITANASLTAQGNDVTLDGGHTSTIAGVELLCVCGGSKPTLGLTGLTLSHGGSGAAAGAIWNETGTVTITGSTLSSNYSGSYGGAIYAGGPVTITNSTLSGNSAVIDGGAIYAGGPVTITNSTLSGNSSGGGGAIHGGPMTITSSTFSGNSAGINGGAIDNVIPAGAGPETITNSTFSGNSATNDGGAIYNFNGPMTITGSTFSGNSAGIDGGAVHNNGKASSSGNIIASSTGGNCSRTSNAITDNGYNLEWSGTGHADTCGFGGSARHDITSTNPQLGSLADNGGPTQTVALAATSSAIDQIPSSSGLCPATDQRGVARPDSGEVSCDIGAYEFTGTDVTPATATAKPTSTPVKAKATAVPTPMKKKAVRCKRGYKLVHGKCKRRKTVGPVPVAAARPHARGYLDFSCTRPAGSYAHRVLVRCSLSGHGFAPSEFLTIRYRIKTDDPPDVTWSRQARTDHYGRFSRPALNVYTHCMYDIKVSITGDRSDYASTRAQRYC
jgi:predicted outer membrane repeat protein